MTHRRSDERKGEISKDAPLPSSFLHFIIIIMNNNFILILTLRCGFGCWQGRREWASRTELDDILSHRHRRRRRDIRIGLNIITRSPSPLFLVV